MNKKIMRNFYSKNFPRIMRAGSDQFRRYNSIFYDLLVGINIPEKEIQCFQPLPDTRFNVFPFGRRKDPGDDIKGENSFNTCIIIVDSKGDTLVHEQFTGLYIFLTQ